MHNPAYKCRELDPYFVAEKSPLESFEKDRPEWADDEIAAIREALHKLALLRIHFDDVEDLVQDTLLTIIAKPPSSELDKGLLVWSLGILRNKVGNYYRKSNRHSTVDNAGVGEKAWSQKSVSFPSPESKAFDTELRTLVREKVAELPPSQREVMELLVAGFDSREIVSHLRPERYQNVINRIHRGRKKLARELAKYGYGPAARMKRARGRKR